MKTIRTHISSLLRPLDDRSGTSAIEFAILSPLFLLLLLGLVAYGIYFGASHSVQQIAADAARTALAGLDQGERQTLATDFVARNAAAYPFVDPDKLTVETRDNPLDPNQFVVSVRYDARALPIWTLFAGIAMPGATIQRSSTIRTGGL